MRIWILPKTKYLLLVVHGTPHRNRISHSFHSFVLAFSFTDVTYVRRMGPATKIAMFSSGSYFMVSSSWMSNENIFYVFTMTGCDMSIQTIIHTHPQSTSIYYDNFHAFVDHFALPTTIDERMCVCLCLCHRWRQTQPLIYLFLVPNMYFFVSNFDQISPPSWLIVVSILFAYIRMRCVVSSANDEMQYFPFISS